MAGGLPRRPEATLRGGPHPAWRLLLASVRVAGSKDALDTLGGVQAILYLEPSLHSSRADRPSEWGIPGPSRDGHLSMFRRPSQGDVIPQRDVHSGHHGPGLWGVSLLRDGQREAWAWGGGWVTGPAGGKVHTIGQCPAAAGPKDSPLLSSEGARRRSEGHHRVTAGSSAQGSRT